MRISDWSSDVCSSDLVGAVHCLALRAQDEIVHQRRLRPALDLDEELGQVARTHHLGSIDAQPEPGQHLGQGGEAHRVRLVVHAVHAGLAQAVQLLRSEESREGKESVSTCRSRRPPSHKKKTYELANQHSLTIITTTIK